MKWASGKPICFRLSLRRAHAYFEWATTSTFDGKPNRVGTGFPAGMKNVRCQVFHADMQRGKRSYGVVG